MQGLFGVSLRETHILKPDSPPSPRKIQHRITQSSEERLGEKIGATEQEMWFESTLCDQKFTNTPTSWKILRAPKSLQMVIAAMKLKDSYSLETKL